MDDLPAPDLRVTLVQGDTRWHDPAGNRDMYARMVAPLAGATDLVLLPETFTSGFSSTTARCPAVNRITLPRNCS